MSEGNRKVGEGQELEEGGWKEPFPLTLALQCWTLPVPPHPLAGGDKDEVLV